MKKINKSNFENIRRSSLDLLVIPVNNSINHHLIEHKHDFYEIVYISKGSGLHTVAKKQYPMLAGDIYLMAPDESHSFQTDTALEYINIIFKETLFDDKTWGVLTKMTGLEILHSKNNKKALHKLALTPIHAKKIIDLTNTIRHEQRQKELGWQLVATEACINILITISRAWISFGHKRPHEYLQTGPISKALVLIHDNWNIELSVKNLAKEVHLSQNYFGEQFKDTLGLTPQQYINKLRIDHARLLLEENNLSISAIAEATGYEDNSYFSRVFKKICGLSPQAYKKMLLTAE
ncbi:MAG: hypothetical protein COA79_02070 [Planctomycetota bacterium]|nr:MAG: hypothetical protein COA79_02070 [Planctomycetota bacterium]